VGFSLQVTSVGYYFAAVFSLRDLTGDLFHDLYVFIMPLTILIVPLAFYIIEFLMDNIFFDFAQAYYCAIPMVFTAFHIFTNFQRAKYHSDLVIFGFDWKTGGISPYVNSVLLTAMSGIIYIILTVASSAKLFL